MIIPATQAHVDHILSIGLRAADVQECLDMCGQTPEVALSETVAASERYWAWLQEDGTVFAMFGVARHPTVADTGIPWLLATEDARRHRKGFVRLVKQYVAEMGQGYKHLTNFVAEDHVESLRWLRYAGFKFIRRFPEFGVGRKPFLQFYKAI